MFTYPAFRRLKKNLGKSDAAMELNEIAVRHLLSVLEAEAEPSKKLKELSTKHKVAIDKVDLGRAHNRISHLYILSVFEESEDFLKCLMRECPSCKAWADRQRTPWLQWFWNNVAQELKLEEPTILFDICEFYRGVRNEFLHSDGEEINLDKRAAELRPRIALIDDLAKLGAPNSYRSTGFDDLILFTRAFKRLSERLCAWLRPRDEDELAQLIREHYERSGNKFNSLRRYEGPRRKNAMHSIVFDYCGLEGEEVNVIVNKLLGMLTNGY